MEYLIDTCVISELSAKRPSSVVREWFSSVRDQDLYLSVVTVGELQKGISRLPVGDSRRERLTSWLAAVRRVFNGRILAFDETMALAWGNLVGESIRAGRTRPAIDAQIAATAIRHGMTLVTRNVRDFESIPVRVVNPF